MTMHFCLLWWKRQIRHLCWKSSCFTYKSIFFHGSSWNSAHPLKQQGLLKAALDWKQIQHTEFSVLVLRLKKKTGSPHRLPFSYTTVYLSLHCSTPWRDVGVITFFFHIFHFQQGPKRTIRLRVWSSVHIVFGWMSLPVQEQDERPLQTVRDSRAAVAVNRSPRA